MSQQGEDDFLQENDIPAKLQTDQFVFDSQDFENPESDYQLKPDPNTNSDQNDNNNGQPFSLDTFSALTKEEREAIVKKVLRQTPEYQSLWEVEVYKENEKIKFNKQLEIIKKQKISEWKKEFDEKFDKKKNSLVDQQKKIEEFTEKLKKKQEELQKKEKNLIDLERELRRRKIDVEKDLELKYGEMEHRMKLLKEECAHKVDLTLAEMEKIKQDKSFFEKQTEDMRKSHLDFEKTKLLATNFEKDNQHLQEKLKSSLDELTQSEKKNSNLKGLAKAQKIEIERLKEDFSKIKSKNQKMKEKLKTMKERKAESSAKNAAKNSYLEMKSQQNEIPPSAFRGNIYGNFEIQNSQMMTIFDPKSSKNPQEVTRLLKEKQDLLDTGIYSENDQVIQEIMHKIQSFY